MPRFFPAGVPEPEPSGLSPGGARTRSDRISPAPTAFHASVAQQLGLGNLDRAAVALDLILRHPQRRTPFSPLVQLGLDLLCHSEVAELLADKIDARGHPAIPVAVAIHQPASPAASVRRDRSGDTFPPSMPADRARPESLPRIA